MLTQQRNRSKAIIMIALAVVCGAILYGWQSSARTAAAQTPTDTPTPMATPTPKPQETYCINHGWERIAVNIAGINRKVLYKAPPGGTWTHGAIIAMHGGSGMYTAFCYPSGIGGTTQMTNFSNLAVSSGFAVFSLDSTNVVTDDTGLLCGKIWDDQVRARDNLDLPFIEYVINTLIPSRRPAGSGDEVFVTGHSSGAWMTLRASTHFDNLVTAFAPVSGGDSYGWYRICDPALGSHGSGDNIVYGKSYDNETNMPTSEVDSCVSETYPNEKPWETTNPPRKPTFKAFYDEDDGSGDVSCRIKGVIQSTAHGYPDAVSYVVPGEGDRTLEEHYWKDEYNQPIIDFFGGFVPTPTPTNTPTPTSTPKPVGGTADFSGDGRGPSPPVAVLLAAGAAVLLLVAGGWYVRGRAG